MSRYPLNPIDLLAWPFGILAAVLLAIEIGHLAWERMVTL
jgi:hypothetical protein